MFRVSVVVNTFLKGCFKPSRHRCFTGSSLASVLFHYSFREDEHDGLGETVLDLPSWIHLPIAQYSACGAQQDTVVSEFNTPFCVFSSMCLSMEGIIWALSAVCPSTAPSQIMPTLCVKAWMLPSVWPQSPRSQTWLRSSGLLEGRRFTR